MGLQRARHNRATFTSLTRTLISRSVIKPYLWQREKYTSCFYNAGSSNLVTNFIVSWRKTAGFPLIEYGVRIYVNYI